MEECEKKATEILNNVTGLAYYLVYLIGACTLAIIIDPITLIFIAIPPIVGIITKKASLKRYELNQTLTSFRRVKAYAARTFFWKDYATEFKLTNINNVITERFRQASQNIIVAYKK